MTDEREFGYEQYSDVAAVYQALRDRRIAYIQAVNQLVCHHLQSSRRLIDIGTGDGFRISLILEKSHVEQAILLEPCKEMASRIRCPSSCAVVTTPIQEFEIPQGCQVDAVTMLWNVFGHIPSRDRLMVARKILNFLVPGGVVILDVNNRHNRAAYGSLRVGLRRLMDWLLPDTRRGDSVFTWRHGETKVNGKGHLFTPREVVDLFQSVGFRLVSMSSVDYETGYVSDTRHDGQLFAVFSR